MINRDYFRENPMSNHLLVEESYSKQIQLFTRLLFFYSLSTIFNFNFSVECGIRTFRISIFCLRQTPVKLSQDKLRRLGRLCYDLVMSIFVMVFKFKLDFAGRHPTDP